MKYLQCNEEPKNVKHVPYAEPKIAKSVSFATSVTVVPIVSLGDYSRNEIESSWYTAEEMEQITRRLLKILCHAESTKSKNAKRYCMRGLEGHTTLGSTSKGRSREAMWASVLDEQKRQQENGIVDAESLAKVCARNTSSSRMWAIVVGNRDQQAAEAYLYQETKEADNASLQFQQMLEAREQVLSRSTSLKKERSSRSAYNRRMNARAA
eukprot:scaffold1054_cov124-Cylindrotheca_fusiformis.AAC.3